MDRELEAYHKLQDVTHFESVDKNGFFPSKPAEKQWLGEGVYFFLNPNGLFWAIKWPMPQNLRSGRKDGIVKTKLNDSLAIDFRNDAIRNKIEGMRNIVKSQFEAAGKPFNDGAYIARLLKGGIFRKLTGVTPTMIIADFDKDFLNYRIENSRIFWEKGIVYQEGSWPQIQACVIDISVIGSLELLTLD